MWRTWPERSEPEPSQPFAILTAAAVVADGRPSFSIAPVNPMTQPLRLRCTSCPWQATVTGPDQIRQQADRHALAHLVDPRPPRPLLARLRARRTPSKENA
jgi:hypothetical protein